MSYSSATNNNPTHAYSYSFSCKIVRKFLKSYARAYKEFQRIWDIPESAIVLIFRFNQDKWNNFKYLIKRIEKGRLTDIWTENKTELKYFKVIKSLFRATEVVFTRGGEFPVQQYRYLQEFIPEAIDPIHGKSTS